MAPSPQSHQQQDGRAQVRGYDDMREPLAPTYIVGIGASAGGLAALEAFFQQVPEKTGLCFVVVQHLSPTFKSMMDELLARVTSLPIQVVRMGMRPAPDTIFLAPPRMLLQLENGVFRLMEPEPEAVLILPIDHFLISLARSTGIRTMAVILSGTGNDGSRGLVDVHDAGGLVVAQEPATTHFEGMPRSACDTGLVDQVLPPGRIPAALLAYAENPEGGHAVKTREVQADESPFATLFRLLWEHHGIDFSNYKLTTLTRRVERRVNLNGELDLDAYIQRLVADQGELNQMYRDLLIGVTRFFRDPEAFDYMAQDIIPQLAKGESGSAEIRVWVAGCASGEEAYSIAILLHEYLTLHNIVRPIQIFATDVHQQSLDVANTGFYSPDALANLSSERLSRYFTAEPQGYRVIPALRQMIVFARHDLTRDAPFTKLDLVTCRNLLIYLEPQFQQHTIRRLHYGLNMQGVLMLGVSESVGELSNRFAELHRHWKVYRKIMPSQPLLDVPTPPLAYRGTPQPKVVIRTAASIQNDFHIRQKLYNVLLDTVVPAGLLMRVTGEAEHYIGHIAPFLAAPHGPKSDQVLDIVHPDLQSILRVAVIRAIHDRQRVSYHHIRLGQDDGEMEVSLHVMPLAIDSLEPSALFVSFDSKVVTDDDTASLVAQDDQLVANRLRTLEEALQRTQLSLQTTVEELQASNEELQATNEELVASNEELQSSNEELQSVNEELHTVNTEYQFKNNQLAELNVDMENLLRSTEIGTIFLDQNGCIRKYTPAVTAVIPLQPQDIGRPLGHFATNALEMIETQLTDLLAEVAQTQNAVSYEVKSLSGKGYILRVHPFMNSVQEMQGSVITLVDITNLEKAKDALRESEARYRSLYDQTPVMMHAVDADGYLVSVNDHWLVTLGYEKEEVLGCRTTAFMTEVSRRHAEEQVEPAYLETGICRDVPYQMVKRNGEVIDVLLSATAVWGTDGRIKQSLAVIVDVTAKKRAEDMAQAYTAALERSNKELDRFAYAVAHDLKSPLRGIDNLAMWVAESASEVLPEKSMQDLQLLRSRVRRLEGTLDGLLDYARIGRANANPELVNPAKLIQEVLAQLDVPAGFSIDVATDMPSLYTFKPALEQIFQNLLDNAIKHHDRPDGHIQVTAQDMGPNVAFTLRDDGPGIPPKMHEKIFELFETVKPRTEVDSSGIGLALVKRTVESQGGAIALEAGDEPGAAFRFTWPKRPVERVEYGYQT